MEPLTVLLASPRGFCAGVRRAVEAVETVRARTDRPVFVRHEIVHNGRVVDGLRRKGVTFVDELAEVPDGAVAMLSAHGVARSVDAEAALRGLPVVDATCPLVRRVHLEAERQAKAGRAVIVIGHEDHPEVVGILGRVDGEVRVVSRVEDVARLPFGSADRLAYVAQTTLSVSDTSEIIKALTARFPTIVGQDTKTICFATQNRQAALREVAALSQRLIVCGASNSSNANRLRELGEATRPTLLIDAADKLSRGFVEGVTVLGITAAASTPEAAVDDVLARLASWRDLSVETVRVSDETVRFAPVDLGALDRIDRSAP